MSHPLIRVGLVGCCLLASAFCPNTIRGDELPQLIERLADEHARGAELWIYNDLDQAFAQARRQQKPLLVTFRCVPCKACAGFDAEVANGSDRIRDIAQQHFVSVRQVEMKGVDLSQFQFDYDLNWAAMFVNADGTVYARYGTQSAEGPDAYNSIEGLEKTMRRVLALHADYPKNRAQLRAKRGPRKPYRTALQMPGLDHKQQRSGPTTRQNCIHCHNIHDAEHAQARASGMAVRDILWRYPLPDQLGLQIDPKDGIRIRRVQPDSPAAKAGLVAGEDVTQLNGQAITSIADMQWVLHHVPNQEAQIEVVGSKTGRLRIRVMPGWKESDVSWRGSLWSLSPRLRVWTPELPEKKRRGLQLSDDDTPLEVRWINRKQPGGRAAYESGLREGDAIVGLAGKPLRLTPARFHLHIKLNYRVGDELPLTVMRDGERRDIPVKLVE